MLDNSSDQYYVYYISIFIESLVFLEDIKFSLAGLFGNSSLLLCSSRTYPYPQQRDSFPRPPSPLEIRIKHHTIFFSVWSYRTPCPQEIPIPFVRGIGIFSGTAHKHSLLFKFLNIIKSKSTSLMHHFIMALLGNKSTFENFTT